MIDAALPSGSSCAADASAACRALRDVYAQSKFSQLDAQPGGDTIFTVIGRWISEALRYLFTHLGTVPSILLLALVGTAIIAFIVWKVRGMSAQRGIVRATAAAEPEPLSDDPEREWKAALDAAARQDYREAIRRAFASALLEVAQHGRLPVDASWTTRELLRAARGDADLVAALAPASASFDEAWYSGHPVAAADWERARGRCETIRTLARRRTPVSTGAAL